jgi:hypothetical protein
LKESLQAMVRSQAIRPSRDVLLVYLNAHGVSRDGQAFLLDSDYKPYGPEGLCEVNGLLRDLEQTPAALKLLVLDAGRLTSEPRIGMMANQFARLVQQQVTELGNQPLWVLLSHSTLQASHVDHAHRRSLFAASLIEALEGKADMAIIGSRMITLIDQQGPAAVGPFLRELRN